MNDIACYTNCFDHCENKALLMINITDRQIVKLCACVGHMRLDIITANNNTTIELYGDGDYRKDYCPIKRFVVIGMNDGENHQEYVELFNNHYYDMINTEKHKYTMFTLRHFYLYPTPEDIEKLLPKRKGVDLSEFAWL